METIKWDGFTDPRQSEMRRVDPLFDGYAELCDSLFRGLRQGAQRLSALDAGPENARAAWVREPTETLDSEIDSAFDGQGGKRALHLIQARFWPIADEFGGDVQVVDRAPANLRGRPQAV